MLHDRVRLCTFKSVENVTVVGFYSSLLNKLFFWIQKNQLNDENKQTYL